MQIVFIYCLLITSYLNLFIRATSRTHVGVKHVWLAAQKAPLQKLHYCSTTDSCRNEQITAQFTDAIVVWERREMTTIHPTLNFDSANICPLYVWNGFKLCKPFPMLCSKPNRAKLVLLIPPTITNCASNITSFK